MTLNKALELHIRILICLVNSLNGFLQVSYHDSSEFVSICVHGVSIPAFNPLKDIFLFHDAVCIKLQKILYSMVYSSCVAFLEEPVLVENPEAEKVYAPMQGYYF